MRIASTGEILEEAREGRMFILVDDEDRENEGDLVIPAQMATPSVVNFMARHGRGLICLALTQDRVAKLGLHPMTARNTEAMGTAFTNSIEARFGVTTGISAADRARTISAAIDVGNGPDALVSPGHVFPLAARDGGVLVRAGHTEAAVDVARLAGLNPSGVICEIMNEDGTMARLPDLLAFAARHDLKIGTIRDLIAYRRRHDRLIERVLETEVVSQFGGRWLARVYRSRIDGIEHLVLRKGEIDPSVPTLVRMHATASVIDMLGERDSRAGLLERAMRLIAEAGAGIVVLLRNPAAAALSEALRTRRRGERNAIRCYGIGAQILGDLEIDRVELLTNSDRSPISIAGFGIEIVGRRSIPEDLPPALVGRPSPDGAHGTVPLEHLRSENKSKEHLP